MGEGLVGRQRNQEARRVGSILNQSDQRGKITDEGGNGMRRSKREYIIRGRMKEEREQKERKGERRVWKEKKVMEKQVWK